MTILLISHTSALDGAERSLAALASCLHKQQMNCLVMCPEPGPLPEALNANQIPISFARLPRPQRDLKHLLIFVVMWPFVVIWLGWWLRKNHISVVYNNTIDGLYAPFAAKLAGVRCIWHIREVKPQSQTKRRPFTWMLHHLPQHTVFNSYATMKAYAYPSPAHWHVIYNGIPIPHDSVTRPQAQAVTVGFAGQFVRHKRPDFFLQAFAQAKKQVPALQAVMAGDGDLATEIRELINRLKLTDSVTMIGYATNMAAYYAMVDIFMLTSEREPFGRVLAEAMAAGCPVIASRVDGVPELVDDTCGFLVDPTDINSFVDKMVLLANDRHLRQRLGAAGKNRITTDFSEEQCCRNLTRLLVGNCSYSTRLS